MAGYWHTGLDTLTPIRVAELRTPRFRLVFSDRAHKPAQFLAERIEVIRDEVVHSIGRDWPGVTELRLGFGRAELEALALPGRRPPPWAVALAYPDRNIVLIEAHSLIAGDGQVTLRHELVHVGLGQFGVDWPHWFQEGLAQELAEGERYRLRQYAILVRAVGMGRILRFADLRTAFPRHPEDVHVAYAQSAAFVRFLRERHGTAAFATLIDRMQSGEVFETAFGIAFKSPLSAEERAFRAELPRRFPWWSLLLSNGVVVWVLMVGLALVAGLWRRRQRVRWRVEHRRRESLEDMALAIIGRLSENDEAACVECPALEEAPWHVVSLRFTNTTAQGRPLLRKILGCWRKNFSRFMGRS